MARKRMVTRTVHATSCEVTAFNLNEKKLDTVTVIVGGHFEQGNKLDTAVTKAMPEGMTFCAINKIDYIEERYGMLEVDFLKYAHKLTKEEEAEADAEDTSDVAEETATEQVKADKKNKNK